jgi:hypothetical protein
MREKKEYHLLGAAEACEPKIPTIFYSTPEFLESIKSYFLFFKGLEPPLLDLIPLNTTKNKHIWSALLTCPFARP